jgi:hypothetical protein
MKNYLMEDKKHIRKFKGGGSVKFKEGFSGLDSCRHQSK